MLNDLQAEFGTASAAEENKKAKCRTAAFPKLFTFREVGTQVSLVMMSGPSQELLLYLLVSTGYKRLAEEGLEGF
jgi:hypothetical protein